MGSLARVPEVCELVARRGRADEVEQFALVQRGEGALILCRSEGGLTQEVYDAPWHVSGVFVELASCARLAQILAGPIGGADVSLPEALRYVLGDEAVQLSDLLDLMDAAGIPYEYRAFAPRVGVLRPSSAA